MHRLLAAARSFEDSPLGMILGVLVVFALPALFLALPEQAVR